jgi:hypothetical protein
MHPLPNLVGSTGKPISQQLSKFGEGWLAYRRTHHPSQRRQLPRNISCAPNKKNPSLSEGRLDASSVCQRSPAVSTIALSSRNLHLWRSFLGERNFASSSYEIHPWSAPSESQDFQTFQLGHFAVGPI